MKSLAIKTRSRRSLWCSSPSSVKSSLIPAEPQLWPCSNAIEVAQAIASAGVDASAAKLHELAPRNYGRSTAQHLVSLAQHSVSRGIAVTARSTSLKILCDQLEHTQANLAQLEREIDNLLDTDAGVKGLTSVPEFGHKTVAVLRAELGDVARFQRDSPGGRLCRARY
jgi:transposase